MTDEDKERIIKKVEDYTMSERATQVLRDNQVLLLVGIAGAGKDTVIRELLKTGGYHFTVSHTTRPPRENNGVMEQNGVEYHFVNWTEIESLVDSGSMIEVQLVHRRNIYGTSVAEIEKAKKAGKVATSDIEVQGVEDFKKAAPSVRAIFLLPPSYEEWQRRLLSRYDSAEGHEEEIHERMVTAEEELQRGINDGYFEFVINDDLQQTIMEIGRIAKGAQSSDRKAGVERAAELLRKVQEYLHG